MNNTPTRIAALVAGSIVGLIGLCVFISGGVLLWGDAKKGDDGYLSTDTHHFATPSRALSTGNVDFKLDGAGWIVGGANHYGNLRLKVTSNNDKPLFVGIAPTSAVKAYLAGSAHALVTDITDSPFQSFHAKYAERAGTARLAPPAKQPFWVASSTGTGTRTAKWHVKEGDWSVVVMNADGSAGVDAGVSAGANAPFLSAFGWGGLGGGLLLLVSAGGLILLGARPPRSDGGADAAPDETAIAPAIAA
jgi:hypothetical protein